MRVIILAFLLLVCCAQHVKAQTRNRDRQPQTQQADNQPTPTPADNRQAEIDNAAKAERERYQQARDAKEDTFKADQLRQNEVIVKSTFWMAVFAGVNLLVAGVYAVFAWLTLRAVKSQAEYAGAQVRKMQGQLRVMKKQTGLTQKTVIQTAKIVKQNERMVNATQGQLTSMQRQEMTMKGQENAMRESLAETRNAIAESKTQTEIMRQSLIVGTRSYMDVFSIENLKQERAIIVIKIGNIGNVPAKDIKGFIEVSFTLRDPSKIDPILEIESPRTRKFPFDYKRSKLFKGKLKIKLFAPIHEQFTQEQINLTFNGYADLVAQITIQYRDDFSKDWRSETFAFLFDDKGGGWFTHPVPIQHADIVDIRQKVSDRIQIRDGMSKSVNNAARADTQGKTEQPN